MGTSENDVVLLAKKLKELSGDAPPLSSQNHYRYPFYHFTPMLPLFCFVPGILIYFFNPCITYTPITLLWSVGGIYIILSVFLSIVLMINDRNLWFCTPLQCRNHLLWEILLCTSFGSTILYYQMYAYFSGIASVFCAVGMLVMFTGSAFWYNLCFNLSHIRACPQKYQPHLEIYQGSACIKTFVAVIDAFIWLGTITLLAFMFAYNNRFLDSTRPAYNICQVPLTTLNPP